MPFPRHEAYRTYVREWIPAHADEADVVPLLERYADALVVLYELDLEPAREVLATCYAKLATVEPNDAGALQTPVRSCLPVGTGHWGGGGGGGPGYHFPDGICRHGGTLVEGQ
ncbi:MAG: hypothetical protein ABMB14_09060 [Myxococcota bacterium]